VGEASITIKTAITNMTTETVSSTQDASSAALAGSETPLKFEPSDDGAIAAAAGEWEDAMHKSLSEIWKLLWKRDFGVNENDIFRALQRECIAHRDLKAAKARRLSRGSLRTTSSPMAGR